MCQNQTFMCAYVVVIPNLGHESLLMRQLVHRPLICLLLGRVCSSSYGLSICEKAQFFILFVSLSVNTFPSIFFPGDNGVEKPYLPMSLLCFFN